jgi:hypothetical protein
MSGSINPSLIGLALVQGQAFTGTRLRLSLNAPSDRCARSAGVLQFTVWLSIEVEVSPPARHSRHRTMWQRAPGGFAQNSMTAVERLAAYGELESEAPRVSRARARSLDVLPANARRL